MTSSNRNFTSFDGLICFGGADWWYHNRGHYDIQMSRQFSRHVPVLYVNSLGVRVPQLTEGAYFFKRVKRKLRSWSRGFVRVEDRFAVVSPMTIPGRLGSAVFKRVQLLQVKQAARRMGMRRPLIWVECPTAADIASQLDGVGLVYQRTDRYESFPGVNAGRIKAFDLKLKARATITLFCSRALMQAEADQCRNPKFIDHGVDFERFNEAGLHAPEPADMAGIARPRAGYIGAIDAHTFDPELLSETARLLPHVQFALIGPCTLSDSSCNEKNVHRLGQKPYEAVAGYMAACDVLIMPWNNSEWIKACNPVKLKEYLAVGRPVISTPFDELQRFNGLVDVASDAESFAKAIACGLQESGGSDARRDRVRGETWGMKAKAVMAELQRLGLRPA
jgi:glycosyltransferase involved in cell wall biosynthesis